MLVENFKGNLHLVVGGGLTEKSQHFFKNEILIFFCEEKLRKNSTISCLWASAKRKLLALGVSLKNFEIK